MSPSEPITSGTGHLQPIRVLIADDSYLIREGLANLLGMSNQVQVVGRHADMPSLLAAVAADPPEVVVTDMRMPPTLTDEGIQIARQLQREYPQVGVIVLSQHSAPGHAARLLEAGARRRGYLLKDRVHDLDQLVSTLQAVARGECRIDAQLVEDLVHHRSMKSQLGELTPRQLEILADVAEGLSNAAIALRRDVSQRAVEKHVSDIFSRLGLDGNDGLSKRVHATLIYLSQNRS